MGLGQKAGHWWPLPVWGGSASSPRSSSTAQVATPFASKSCVVSGGTGGLGPKSPLPGPDDLPGHQSGSTASTGSNNLQLTAVLVRGYDIMIRHPKRVGPGRVRMTS